MVEKESGETFADKVYKRYSIELKEDIQSRNDIIKGNKAKEDYLKEYLLSSLLSNGYTGYSFIDIPYVMDNIIKLERLYSESPYEFVSHSLTGVLGPSNNSNNKPFWDIILDDGTISRLLLFCAKDTLYLTIVVVTGDSLIDNYILETLYSRAYSLTV